LNIGHVLFLRKIKLLENLFINEINYASQAGIIIFGLNWVDGSKLGKWRKMVLFIVRESVILITFCSYLEMI
jgi:hypothetical protein